VTRSPLLARPAFVLSLALVGLAWNGYGVVQFVHSLTDSVESLTQMGMTAEQAATYAHPPAWMSAGFGLGAFGGLLGCALVLARRAAAVPVFAASLVGYVVLYIGDITEGIFAALGAPQVAVLSTVVAIAAALWGWSRSLVAHGVLDR